MLTSFPFKDKKCVFRTSGTSRDAKGAHFFDTLRLYERSVPPLFEKHLLPDGAELSYFFLISPSRETPHSSLSFMMRVVDRHFAGGRGRYYVKNDKPLYSKLAADLKKARGKVFLLSTALTLKGFLEFLSAGRIKISLVTGSRLMETGGFKGRTTEISKAALYARCAKYLGIPKSRCVSEYGMTELSSQMYSVAGGVFAGPAWLRTRVVDPRTGQEAKKSAAGILCHVDLANRGSVLAVQTEDLGRSVDGGFELLGRAKGSELRGCSLTYEEFIRNGE